MKQHISIIVAVTLWGCLPPSTTTSNSTGEASVAPNGPATAENGGTASRPGSNTSANSDDVLADVGGASMESGSPSGGTEGQPPAPSEARVTFSEEAKAFFDAPTTEALMRLADEYEATDEEIKTAGLFWTFVIAAQVGDPVSPIFFYSEFQREVQALGLKYPSLLKMDNDGLRSSRQPLIRSGRPFTCREACIPDPVDFLKAAGEGVLDLAITDGLLQLKKATQTLSRTVNKAQRFKALSTAADNVTSLGGATSAAERAAAVAEGKMGMSMSDALEVAGGVISGLGLLGVQSARLTVTGMVVTAFGAGTKIGEAIYEAQRLVEDCWRFQEEQCQCGNESLDPGESCDYSVADSCLYGDDNLCEPVVEECMAAAVVGDPQSCNETCIPKRIEYCKSNDDCCPLGCAPDVAEAPYSLRDNDCMPECGNGVAEFGEVCDRGHFDRETCKTQGAFSGGQLQCSADCLTIETEACFLCGNGIKESGEMCELQDFNGQTCESLGLGSGELRCDLSSNCQTFDTSRCAQGCGNGVRDEGEQCDGNDVGGQSCDSLTGLPGRLGCHPDCTFKLESCECDPGCFYNILEEGCTTLWDSECLTGTWHNDSCNTDAPDLSGIASCLQTEARRQNLQGGINWGQRIHAIVECQNECTRQVWEQKNCRQVDGWNVFVSACMRNNCEDVLDACPMLEGW